MDGSQFSKPTVNWEEYMISLVFLSYLYELLSVFLFTLYLMFGHLKFNMTPQVAAPSTQTTLNGCNYHHTASYALYHKNSCRTFPCRPLATIVLLGDNN